MAFCSYLTKLAKASIRGLALLRILLSVFIVFASSSLLIGCDNGNQSRTNPGVAAKNEGENAAQLAKQQTEAIRRQCDVARNGSGNDEQCEASVSQVQNPIIAQLPQVPAPTPAQAVGVQPATEPTDAQVLCANVDDPHSGSASSSRREACKNDPGANPVQPKAEHSVVIEARKTSWHVEVGRFANSDEAAITAKKIEEDLGFDQGRVASKASSAGDGYTVRFGPFDQSGANWYKGSLENAGFVALITPAE
jgi:hypothetical protein